MIRLAVVIINYCTADLTLNCLRSLAPEMRNIANSKVIIVDNASNDGSDKKIELAISKNHWDEWVNLRRSSVNKGFSFGNNLGIQTAEADFYLLANSDILMKPGTLSELLEAMEKNPRVGLIGPRLESHDGRAQSSCFRHPTPLSELIRSAATGPITKLLSRHEVALPPSDYPSHPDCVSFACVMLRGRAIREIGPLDEGFFMYFEDMDYCRRAQHAGWDVLYWPSAQVIHLRGGSSPVKAAFQLKQRPPRYYYTARARYLGKYYGRLGLWLANFFWILGRGMSFIREILGHRPKQSCDKQFIDNWTNWLSPLKPPVQHNE